MYSCRDLVAAHKGLLKEKKTLETSLKVMSRASTDVCKSAPDNENKLHSTVQNPVAENTQAHSISKDDSSSNCEMSASDDIKDNSDDSNSFPKDNSEIISELQSRVGTLMKSLTTLTEEKSRMEAGFQADKKALRSEKDTRDQIISDLRKEIDLNRTLHQNEIDNYKSRILIERHEREKEHHDHGVMIRELQKLLAEERSAREKAEGNVEDFRQQLSVLTTSLEQKEKDLTNQMDNLKSRLGKERDVSGPLVTSLQEEISSIKQQHLVELQEIKVHKELQQLSNYTDHIRRNIRLAPLRTSFKASKYAITKTAFITATEKFHIYAHKAKYKNEILNEQLEFKGGELLKRIATVAPPKY